MLKNIIICRFMLMHYDVNVEALKKLLSVVPLTAAHSFADMLNKSWVRYNIACGRGLTAKSHKICFY